jgi:outer membrane murein-binding lipoprotein Lpp
MRKTLFIAMLAILLSGCNINPSKVARIQQLEAEMQQMSNAVMELESQVEALEEKNKELEMKIVGLKE